MGPLLIGFFSLITVVGICLILYFTAYNRISIIKIKMDNANDIIADNLTKKQELMDKLYEQIKSVQTMINLKEDNKKLDTKSFNKTLNEIKQIEQIIRANKVFFNKNNNDLFKQMKGYTKIVAKITKISVKNSYEIKEPMESSL